MGRAGAGAAGGGVGLTKSPREFAVKDDEPIQVASSLLTESNLGGHTLVRLGAIITHGNAPDLVKAMLELQKSKGQTPEDVACSLGHGLYECRHGLTLRLVFAAYRGLLYFHIIGSHDDVRDFLMAHR
jgi:hypothetical protein